MKRMRGHLSLTLSFLAASAVPAAAQNLLSRIGWKGAELWVIILLLVLLLAAIGILIALYAVRRLREKADMNVVSDRLFEQSAQRCGLTDIERQKLRSLLRHEPAIAPHVIFQSVSIFERCVHADVDEIVRTSRLIEDRRVEEDLLGGVRKKLGFNVLPLEHPLVSTRNISIGQNGAVFGKNPRQPLIQKAMVVQNKEFFLCLEYDIQKEEGYQFIAGNQVKFAFARQNDGFYGISLTVLEYDGAGTLTLGHSLELKRNQLRQYARVEVNIPLKFSLVKTSDPEKSEVKRGLPVEAKISDVSGGGMSFLSPVSLKPADIISANFKLQQIPFAGVAGKILRVSLQESKTQTLFRHHVEFQEMDPTKREKIVKFVFERQRQINQWR